jgi:hypothetical protein
MGRKKQKHWSIKTLDGAYWTLHKVGLFFWLSAKYQYLGVKSIAESFKGIKSNIPDDSKESNPIKEKIQSIKRSRTPAQHVDFEEVSSVSGDFNTFYDRLSKDSSIVLIAGKRGSGKSALAFRLLENIHSKNKRPVSSLDVKASVMPSWIGNVDSLDEVKNNSIVLVDEGAIAFGARDSMSKKNKKLGELLAIARHKNLTLLLITQNTGMIDKNVLNLCDTVIVKQGSLLQQKMERKALKDLFVTANKALTSDKSQFYVFDNDFEGVLSASLPSFWSDDISKNKA